MKPYMTPGRFRIGGYGVDLSDITDGELRSVLQTSTSMVNSYCTVPMLPLEYDFRGGTVVDEEIEWSISHPLLPGVRRVLPHFTPIKAVDSFRIEVTNDQYIGFDAGELYVTESSVEVVSLAITPYGLFGATALPFVGLQTPMGRLSYSYGYSFPVIGDELVHSDAKEFRALNQWWDDAETTVIYLDGVAQGSGFSINYDEGSVTFTTAPAATAVVTADYTHRMPTPITDAIGLVAMQRLGERNLTRKGLYGLVELAVGEVRLRRDFPRAGVARHGMSDEVMQLIDPFKFVSVRGS